MRFIKEYFGEIIIVIPVVYWTIFAFNNPKLTQTQIFLELWFLLIPMVLGVIVIKIKIKKEFNDWP